MAKKKTSPAAEEEAVAPVEQEVVAEVTPESVSEETVVEETPAAEEEAVAPVDVLEGISGHDGIDGLNSGDINGEQGDPGPEGETPPPVEEQPVPEPEPKIDGPEFVSKHVEDWTFCKKGGFFPGVQKKLKENIGDFNFSDAYNRPSTIRYRQMVTASELDTKNGKVTGVPGDYLFMDCVGGKVIVPYLIFKMAEF